MIIQSSQVLYQKFTTYSGFYTFREYQALNNNAILQINKHKKYRSKFAESFCKICTSIM